jgi:curved DNA-binding protein CbpA
MNQQVVFDYYDVLQVSPIADQETIDKVYRFLAKKYHPDNGSGEGNADKFRAIIEAYRVLSDPEKRAAYDAKNQGKSLLRDSNYDMDSDYDAAKNDRRLQQGILLHLYWARRRDPLHAGVGSFELERLLGAQEKNLEFHIWYLKEKGWIARIDTGEYVITANGVDAVVQRDLSIDKDRLLPQGAYDTKSDEKIN